MLCRRLGKAEEADQDLKTAFALFELVGDCEINDQLKALCWFGRADTEGDHFERAVQLVFSEFEDESSLWGFLVNKAFEMDRWPELRSRLEDSGMVFKLANADWFINSACPTSIWTRRDHKELIESRRKQLIQWLEPHVVPKKKTEDPLRQQFESFLEQDDWRAASKLDLETLGRSLGRRSLYGAIVECAIAEDGLAAAIQWTEQIEDFTYRQLAKLAAVTAGMAELNAPYLNNSYLSFRTLEWPAFGC